jgi:methyl-accepting chemotaxis protein
MGLKSMPLGHRLMLMICASLLLAVGAGLYGVGSVNRSALTFAALLDNEVTHQRLAQSTLVEFKAQVQAWKDTLLRGKDPAQLQKYWAEFEKHELEVQQQARDLWRGLPGGDSRDIVQRFIDAHSTMGQRYRHGLDLFKASDFEPTAGDTGVKGMDREPAQLLAQVVQQETAALERASVTANGIRGRAYALTLVLMAAALAAGTLGGYLIARSVTRELGGEPSDARAVAKRIAQGDLFTAIPVRPGDRTTLFAALHEMQTALASIVGQIRASSDSIATGSAEIAMGNSDLSQRTEEQASNVQQTAASMEQLSCTVKNVADTAAEASRLASGASQVAVEGGERVGKIVATMQEISASSKKIADIIGVIDGIAFQTNILALNAAVEAARAGALGRGFAVVAGEVRSLAGRSAEAAKEIKTLITLGAQRVDAGAREVDAAGASMNEIVAQVQRVTHMIGDLSTASTEQSQGIGQVGDAVQQLDQVTQQNAALVEETAAAAESLRHQAAELTNVIARFRLAAV